MDASERLKMVKQAREKSREEIRSRLKEALKTPPGDGCSERSKHLHTHNEVSAGTAGSGMDLERIYVTGK
jgi:hypothetical protein